MITARTMRLTGGERGKTGVAHVFVCCTDDCIFKIAKVLGASPLPSPLFTPSPNDCRLHCTSARKSTIRNHCLRFGLYSYGETIPQRLPLLPLSELLLFLFRSLLSLFLLKEQKRIYYCMRQPCTQKPSRCKNCDVLSLNGVRL